MKLGLKYVPPLVMLAIGTALVLVAQTQDRERLRLSANGVPGTASVVSKFVETRPKTGDPKTNEQKPRVTYRFKAQDGAEIENTVSVGMDVYDRLKVGKTLPMTYRADEPSLHAIGGLDVLVSGGAQYAHGSSSPSFVMATVLAALSVAWILLAPRVLG